MLLRKKKKLKDNSKNKISTMLKLNALMLIQKENLVPLFSLGM